MIICEVHNLTINGIIVATLRVYLRGSGKPEEEHQILGLAVDGHTIGEGMNQGFDKMEIMEPWAL